LIKKLKEKTVRQLLFGLTVFAMFIPEATSESATLENLKGLSIEIRFTFHVVYRTSDGSLRGPVRQDGISRIFFSSKGNIFEADELSPNPLVTRKWQKITPFDRAAGARPDIDSLQAWTINNGNLTKITQIAQGFMIVTIAVDPIGMSCTYENRLEPDANTGKTFVYSLVDNRPSEIDSRSVASYTCRVVKGNIFASDE
jgi:hypothetical protein